MIDYDALREALRDECYGCIDLEAEELTQLKTLLDKALSVEEIPAYCVRTACKIGYLRLCKRPHLQAVLSCLAGFSTACQSVDFVNILSELITNDKLALLYVNPAFWPRQPLFSRQPVCKPLRAWAQGYLLESRSVLYSHGLPPYPPGNCRVPHGWLSAVR